MPNKFPRRVRTAAQVLIGGESRHSRERIIPPISLDEVQEARQFFPCEKFFIFGHARSGTTLLTRLVRVHPDVHCNYQAHFFTRAPLLESLVSNPEIGTWLSRRSNRWNHGSDLSPVVLRVVSDYIMEREARPLGKHIVGDKSPNSLLDGEAVRLLVKVYPDARLVFIVRDGRDAVVSHRFQAFIDTPQHLAKADLQIRADFIHNPQPFLTGKRSIFTEKSLRDVASGWVKNVVETDREAKTMLAERYLSLRYEDLIADPWKECCRLWDFLGADVSLPDLQELLSSEMQQNPDADWQQQKASEIAGSLQKGQRGTWKELFTSRDQEIFNQIAGDVLLAWGYEKYLSG